MKKTLLFSDAVRAISPVAFQIMIKPIGSVCNLDCVYCYYLEKKKLYPEKNDFRMSGELLEKIIKEYIDAVNVPVVNFIWQGGEPTLMGIDFFRNAIALQKKYANGKMIENSFQTNGTRLNDEWCRFFQDNHILIGISIDGPEHNHDRYRKSASGKSSFSQVMNGIELLKKHKVEFNTLSCVNSYNVKYASETYRFLKGIGSRFMQFLPVVERIVTEKTDKALELVSNEYTGDAKPTEWSVNGGDYGRFLITIFDEWVRKDVGMYFVPIFDAALANMLGITPGICVFAETCGAALVVEHNGDVFSCDHYVYPEYFLGNINEKSFSEMAGSAFQFEFGINKRNSLPHQCLLCNVRYACNGECPKHRISRTGDGQYGLNYLCEGYKAFYSYAEPYFKFMADELTANRSPANVMNWLRNKGK